MGQEALRVDDGLVIPQTVSLSQEEEDPINQVDGGERGAGADCEGGDKLHSTSPCIEEGSSKQEQSEYFKTSLCSFFRKSNSCRHAQLCRYAHGEAELRPKPDGSWDPTSQRVKNTVGASHGTSIKQKKRKKNVEEDEEGLDEAEHTDGSLRKCITDLPLRWSSEDLNVFLRDQGVAFRMSKKRKRFAVGFIEFESDEQTKLAKQKLDGMMVQSRQLKIADARPRAWQSKQGPESMDNPGLETQTKTETKPANICEIVTPLAALPYEQQLQKKSSEVSQILKKLVRNVRKAVSSSNYLPDWILDAKSRGGLCCPFEGVIASPSIDGYRNKCEFTIGHSKDGNRAVGFLSGNFREGCVFVSEPDGCQNVSPIARAYAKSFQEFVQNSKLPIWDKNINGGFWRLFTVREGRALGVSIPLMGQGSIAEVMLIVQICSVGVEETTKEKEFESMAQHLAEFAEKSCPPLPLTVLLVQDHQGISNAASPDSPLTSLSIPRSVAADSMGGEDKKDSLLSVTTIHDYILDLRFRISATAFFQVNTLAAEKLYCLAGDWARLSHDTLLFDVCCGTGTIGLTLARSVGMVVGIEMNEAAVDDARINAQINGIQNCEFVCGKAEHVMHSLLKKYLSIENKALGTEDQKVLAEDSCHGNLSERTFSSAVVIVDPPRSGLHPSVIKVLRAHEQISRLVYVSCNPETLLANAVELCTPILDGGEDNKSAKGSNHAWKRSVVGHARQRVKSMPVSKPFRPVKSVAVDLFPHTPHCEVVMLMER